MISFSSLLGERAYISQYAVDTVGVVIYVEGVPADVGDVTVSILNLDDTYLIEPDLDISDDPIPGTGTFQLDTVTEEAGEYQIQLQSAWTASPGVYKLLWEYELDTVPQTFVSLIEVGESAPAYDALSDDFKGLIESVYMMFADLFDSPFGGPHLQVYFQTRFSRGRMAQMLSTALGRLNIVSQPTTVYTLGPEGTVFPLGQWGALLHKALYVELIKHLRRSYVEQPLAQNVTVARLDRRDYMDRWGTILRDEEADLATMLDTFKIAHMGLGKVRTLVSGGVYGRFGPTRMARGAGAARGYFWTRVH